MGRLKTFYQKETAVGIVIVILITLLMTSLIYFKEPIGDDILGGFDGALTFYLDEYPDELGERLTSLTQVSELVRFVYLKWSGRIPGYVLNYIGYLLPQIAKAVITSVMYTMICLLALRIIFHNMKIVFAHPLYYLILYLALFWTRPSVWYTHMWIMTCIYAGSLLLCLAYWNIDKAEKQHWIQIMGVQFVGLLAGMAHEVISLCFITVILCEWILAVLGKKKHWKTIFAHSGLGVGYVIGFFAPGNWNRRGGSHDAVTSGWLSRFRDSIFYHRYIITSEDHWMKITTLIFVSMALVAFAYILLRRGNQRKTICNDVLPIVVGEVVSLLVWSIMPHIQPYALDFGIVAVFLLIIKLLDKAFGNIRIASFCQQIGAVILLCFVLTVYSGEVTSCSSIALERMQRINAAVELGEQEVTVPKYPEEWPQTRYAIGYLNDQVEYDWESHCKYYKIHIILENEGAELF